jgi:methyl-accepting chemotaxis protein
MKMTIGKKLGIGFAIVMLLMTFSAGVAYVSIRSMNSGVSTLTESSYPAVRSCNELTIGIGQSLAALRGNLILGEDPQRSREFKEDRRQAWQMIDASMASLERYLADWPETDRRRVEAIRAQLSDLREVQRQVDETAHTIDNIPSHRVLTSEAMPRATQIVDALSVIIDEEAGLELTGERKQLLMALADMRGSFAMGLANVRAFLLTGKDTYQEQFDRHWQRHETAFQKAARSAPLLTAQQNQSWATLVRLRNEFQPLPAQMFALRAADDWNRARYLLDKQAVPQGRAITNAVTEVTESAVDRARAIREELLADGRMVVWTLLVSAAVAIALGALIATMLSRRIAAMLRTLAGRAAQISTGDLTGAALTIKSADELGQLANSFDVMLASLKDLTGQIHSVTENVNSAATQISASTQQQAASSKEQAATIQEITSTMQEISQSGAQIVEKARQVATAADAAASSSKAGLDSVNDTTQTMEAIREQVEEVAENIVALSEKTQAVGEIIATVNDIAEQSNLLALNATIEAADAGDDGNRFAVVASEMKNLADQAKECTVQVRTILSEIQKGINSAVMLTEEAVKRVESGKQQAEISERTIRQMSSMTDDSLQAFQQIIGATNQQQVGFEQVARGMQDIDQATQQTASGTAQLEQAVLCLSSLSRQLKSAVGSYRV